MNFDLKLENALLSLILMVLNSSSRSESLSVSLSVCKIKSSGFNSIDERFQPFEPPSRMAQALVGVLGNRDSLATILNRSPTTAAVHLVGFEGQLQTAHVPIATITEWVNRDGLSYLNNLGYAYGRIVITEPGLHFVYSQLTFEQEIEGQVSGITSLLTMQHRIYRYNILNPDEEFILETSVTKPLGLYESHTSYIGGVFNLRVADELYVKASDLSLISQVFTQNYFGLYKIG